MIPAIETESSAALAAHWCGGNHAAAHLLLGRAARGDVEAQQLLTQGLADIAQTHPAEAGEHLVGAELMGRMAASHGAPLDRRRLAGVLALQAAYERKLGAHDSATELEAECLVLLNMLADEGFEEAADAVSTFALCFSPEAVASACAETAGPHSAPRLRLFPAVS